jgi:hypothetical protein
MHYVPSLHSSLSLKLCDQTSQNAVVSIEMKTAGKSMEYLSAVEELSTPIGKQYILIILIMFLCATYNVMLWCTYEICTNTFYVAVEDTCFVN